MFQRERQGAVEVLRGESPLTKDYVKQLDALLEPLLRAGQSHVVFNLSQVPHIDSAGLEKLLDLQDALEHHGGELKLASPNSLCAEILAVTAVAKRFEIFKDLTSAVGSFVQ
jgi:anti-anti-sigma factor